MCFAPQPRALFQHLSLQKWSEHGVFCTFWLENVLRATTACTFSTSQLPKVVRGWCVLYILTWKCDISTSKSGPTLVCFEPAANSGGGVGATHLVAAPAFFSTKCLASIYRMGCLEISLQSAWPWISFFTTKWMPKRGITGGVNLHPPRTRLLPHRGGLTATPQGPGSSRQGVDHHPQGEPQWSRIEGDIYIYIFYIRIYIYICIYVYIYMYIYIYIQIYRKNPPFSSGPGIFLYKMPCLNLQNGLPRNFSTKCLALENPFFDRPNFYLHPWAPAFLSTKCLASQSWSGPWTFSQGGLTTKWPIKTHFVVALRPPILYGKFDGGCVLYILTCKCASRHNGVHFFDISTSKNTVNRDFPTFSRICIFFLLIFSLPTLLTSAFQLSILSEVWLLNFLRLYIYIYYIIICIFILCYIIIYIYSYTVIISMSTSCNLHHWRVQCGWLRVVAPCEFYSLQAAHPRNNWHKWLKWHTGKITVEAHRYLKHVLHGCW